MKFIRNISDSQLTDEELAAQYYSGGSPDLLAALYGRYMELVYSVCVKYLDDTEAAKDAVMDIYAELTSKLQRHEVSNFKSWLHTLARNHCLMKLRGTKAMVISINEERVHSAEELHQEDNKEQKFEILTDCMEKLPAEQRDVVSLFYLKEMCYKDIAALTGFDWNKIRSLVQNGRRNLKICADKKIAEKSGKMD